MGLDFMVGDFQWNAGRPDLLETLKVLTQLGVQSAGGQLCKTPVPEVFLSAQRNAQGKVSSQPGSLVHWWCVSMGC